METVEDKATNEATDNLKLIQIHYGGLASAVREMLREWAVNRHRSVDLSRQTHT